MTWHVAHNRALHRHLFVLHIETLPIPRVATDQRVAVTKLAANFWRIEVRYGFMEHLNIPEVLTQVNAEYPCVMDLADLTYYVGHATIVRRVDGHGIPAWQASTFAMMERNSVHISDFLRLPNDQVVEIGRQIAI